MLTLASAVATVAQFAIAVAVLVIGGGGAVLVIRALMRGIGPQLRGLDPSSRRRAILAGGLTALLIVLATIGLFILAAHSGS